MDNEEERIPWSRPRMRLGDKVEKILKPVVEVIDNNLGTNLKECQGCKKRKEMLNKLDEDILGPDN